MLKFYRGLLLSVSIIMMGIGIYRGELKIVIAKATRICLECIGIG